MWGFLDRVRKSPSRNKRKEGRGLTDTVEFCFTSALKKFPFKDLECTCECTVPNKRVLSKARTFSTETTSAQRTRKTKREEQEKGHVLRWLKPLVFRVKLTRKRMDTGEEGYEPCPITFRVRSIREWFYRSPLIDLVATLDIAEFARQYLHMEDEIAGNDKLWVPTTLSMFNKTKCLPDMRPVLDLSVGCCIVYDEISGLGLSIGSKPKESTLPRARSAQNLHNPEELEQRKRAAARPRRSRSFIHIGGVTNASTSRLLDGKGETHVLSLRELSLMGTRPRSLHSYDTDSHPSSPSGSPQRRCRPICTSPTPSIASTLFSPASTASSYSPDMRDRDPDGKALRQVSSFRLPRSEVSSRPNSNHSSPSLTSDSLLRNQLGSEGRREVPSRRPSLCSGSSPQTHSPTTTITTEELLTIEVEDDFHQTSTVLNTGRTYQSMVHEEKSMDGFDEIEISPHLPRVPTEKMLDKFFPVSESLPRNRNRSKEEEESDDEEDRFQFVDLPPTSPASQGFHPPINRNRRSERVSTLQQQELKESGIDSPPTTVPPFEFPNPWLSSFSPSPPVTPRSSSITPRSSSITPRSSSTYPKFDNYLRPHTMPSSSSSSSSSLTSSSSSSSSSSESLDPLSSWPSASTSSSWQSYIHGILPASPRSDRPEWANYYKPPVNPPLTPLRGQERRGQELKEETLSEDTLSELPNIGRTRNGTKHPRRRRLSYPPFGPVAPMRATTFLQQLMIPYSIFHTISKLREGNFGKIFRAMMEGNLVVIKVPKGKPGRNEWAEYSALKELKLHPNPYVVPFHGFCPDFRLGRIVKDVLCPVMEYEPQTLQDYINTIPIPGPPSIVWSSPFMEHQHRRQLSISTFHQKALITSVMEKDIRARPPAPNRPPPPPPGKTIEVKKEVKKMQYLEVPTDLKTFLPRESKKEIRRRSTMLLLIQLINQTQDHLRLIAQQKRDLQEKERFQAKPSQSYTIKLAALESTEARLKSMLAEHLTARQTLVVKAQDDIPDTPLVVTEDEDRGEEKVAHHGSSKVAIGLTSLPLPLITRILSFFSPHQTLSVLSCTKALPSLWKFKEHLWKDYFLLNVKMDTELEKHWMETYLELQQELLPWRFVLKVLWEMCRGLQHLHQLKMIHRDVALRNFLVSRQGRVMICDFGLSRIPDDPSGYYFSTSSTDLPVRWMPPEALGSHKFSANSDIYSLGVAMYEVLTLGRALPFHGKPNIEVVNLVAHNLMRLSIPPHVPTPIRGIIETCLSFHEHLRPSCPSLVDYFGRLLVLLSLHITK